MTLAEYFEEYRFRRIGELDDKQQKLVAKIGELEAEKRSINQALARAECPYPEGEEFCPRCWVFDGAKSPVKRIGPPHGETLGEYEQRIRCDRSPPCPWEEILTE